MAMMQVALFKIVMNSHETRYGYCSQEACKRAARRTKKGQMARALRFLCMAVALAQAVAAQSGSDIPFPVRITVWAGAPRGEMKSIWRFFGADEPNYAYMKDGKKLLSELGQLGGPQVYFRCHHLLTSGDGAYALKWSSTSAYKEDTNGNPVYDWAINDRIFDTYLECGIKPY